MGYFQKKRNALIVQELKEEYGITIIPEGATGLTECPENRSGIGVYEKAAEPVLELAKQLAVSAGNYNALSQPAWTVTMEGVAVTAEQLVNRTNGAFLLNTRTGTHTFGVMADLNPVDNSFPAATNIAAMAWAIMSYVTQKHYLEKIDESLAEIQKTVSEIKQFIEQDKQSQIEADLFLMHEIIDNIQDIKLNPDLKSMKLNQVSMIQREAKRNIVFYEKIIRDGLENYEKQKKKGVEKKQIEELRQAYWYYNLSTQIYALSLIIEAVLSDNLSVDNLKKLKHDLQKHDAGYSELCDTIIGTVYGHRYNKLSAKIGIAFSDTLGFLGRVSERTPLEKTMIDDKLQEWGETGRQGIVQSALLNGH